MRGVNRPSFERYLKTKANLDGKVASDTASICARVERAFDLNLDVELPRGELSNPIEWLKTPEGRQRMNYVGSEPRWYEPAVRALEKYADFLKDEHRDQR
jgi:hypothetical protein